VIDLMGVRAKLHETYLELAGYHDQNIKLQKEMQQMMASNSWKLTAPLRRLFRLFGSAK
jgi:hypothetical protein